jgi:hypothetical protein
MGLRPIEINEDASADGEHPSNRKSVFSGAAEVGNGFSQSG